MDLARQKEIIQHAVDNFNNMNLLSDYTISATWFVSDGDVWVIRRSDDKVLGNYLTFDQAFSIINALSFYKGE